MSNINRVERLIINMDTELPNSCSWGPCDRRSRTPYQIIHHQHMPMRCSWVDAAGGAYGVHYHYAFCGEDCLDLWKAMTGRYAQDTADRHRGVIEGNHTPGHKLGRYR